MYSWPVKCAFCTGQLISIRNFYHHTTRLFWTYESSPSSVAYDCHFMILWNILNRISARTKALLPPPMLEPFEIRLQNLQTSERSKRAKQPCDPSKNNYLHTQRDSRLATTSKIYIYIYVTLHRNLMLKVKARTRHACTTRLACRRSRICAY